MAQTFTFPGRANLPTRPRGPRAFRRSLGDKLQEIAHRGPKDLAAFETLADSVLARLNVEDRERPH